MMRVHNIAHDSEVCAINYFFLTIDLWTTGTNVGTLTDSPTHVTGYEDMPQCDPLNKTGSKSISVSGITYSKSFSASQLSTITFDAGKYTSFRG